MKDKFFLVGSEKEYKAVLQDIINRRFNGCPTDDDWVLRITYDHAIEHLREKERNQKIKNFIVHEHFHPHAKEWRIYYDSIMHYTRGFEGRLPFYPEYAWDLETWED